MNSDIIQQLKKLAEVYGALNDTYRELAYLTAARSIQSLDYKLTPDILGARGHAHTKIPGVGKGISEKILEFLTTGKIAELDKLLANKSANASKELSNLLGFGPVQVAQLIARKIYTIQQLREAFKNGRVSLTRMQELGLKYAEDLSQRIPRAEVEALAKMIHGALVKHLHITNLKFEVSGSYRRGALDSGDIDIIITCSKSPLADLQQIVEKSQYTVAIVSAGASRLTFLIKSPVSNKVRSIDVLYTPEEQYWAAVNYFTGSAVHNQFMRHLAKSRGYRLNQTGLYKVEGGKTKHLKLIPITSERDIYTILGTPYVEPGLR